MLHAPRRRDSPTVEHDLGVATVQQRDRLAARPGAGGVDHGRHDLHQRIPIGGGAGADGLTGGVGVPALRLERQEHRDPAVGEADQQCAILPRAVGPSVLRLGVTLVHVDIVDAALGDEAEILVRAAVDRLVLLAAGRPALAEGVDPRPGVGERGAQQVVEQELLKVVGWPIDAERHDPHLVARHQRLAHGAPDIVQRQCRRGTAKVGEAVGELAQPGQDRMRELLDLAVEQGGVAGARLDVDGDAVRGTRSVDLDLDMRAGILVQRQLDRTADEHVVVLERHDRPPGVRRGPAPRPTSVWTRRPPGAVA